MTLAPELVDWLETHLSHAEPLMFDGAHPDSEGFKVFAREVATFVKAQGWR
jgi:lysophospholipase L1-like esterase